LNLPGIFAAALGLCLFVGNRGLAEDAATDAVFQQQVLPILAKNCTDCHSSDEQEAGLDLSTRDGLLQGSKAGYVIVPGKSAESLLVQLLVSEGKPHMPPDGRLADANIEAIRRWIDDLPPQALPSRGSLAQGRDLWSLRPMVCAAQPEVKDAAWLRTPVDAFVLSRLEAAGLAPAEPADKVHLVRRAYFDLTGLPPSPAEVQAFVADAAPDAYERLLDRLLASPAYGERWARHWLDLARYADSGGFHDDLDRPHAWRYRDYVIRSFNADKPYAQFVREQLAGDELAPRDAQSLAATAFGRNGPSNDNNVGKEKEKYRLDQLDDTLSTTSVVFLGLTIGCARCHDHKFDPISQTDYYRFLAIFNNTVRKDVPLDEAGCPVPNAGKPKTAKPKPDKSKSLAAVMVMTEVSSQAPPTYLRWRGDFAKRGPEVQPGVPAALVPDDFVFAMAESKLPTTGRRLALADWISQPENPLAWRVIANRLWQHHFARGIVATPSNFGMTGELPTHPLLLDYLALETARDGGELKRIQRLILSSATYRQSSRASEALLAADPQNLLLGRMNKQRLEGEAIRDSILAVAGTLNTAMGGPGIKPRIPAELLVASQRNKWPIVKQEGPQHWRRSVYVYVKRQLPMPLLELFDSPDTSQTCAARQQSTVPTQALVLMNDQFVQDQAGYFAERVARLAADADEPAALALQLALGTSPSAARVAEAKLFLNEQQAAHRQAGLDATKAQRQALTDLCHVLLNCNEFVFVD
jgi:hypothetical protein